MNKNRYGVASPCPDFCSSTINQGLGGWCGIRPVFLGVGVFFDRFLWFFDYWIPTSVGMTVWRFRFFRWIPVALGGWIPAFAGMTVWGFLFFPMDSCCVGGWIPAFAGMTRWGFRFFPPVYFAASIAAISFRRCLIAGVTMATNIASRTRLWAGLRIR
ncbi:Uncharacterised protein [Neisseria meningitidis]|nr:GPI mannosyltransferase 3 domain protein [Neisseria meningitidis 98008]EJU72133.1 GPI mannosyltransferase 3 domain protein [Neisseria meningitidis 92045]EPF55928.1 GPI mannosyltransferase 3 domain protein [Neisseria meningitidis NM134]CWO23975.1 Uncharacterised protein [Neisseria meningitidis]CWR72772.1 Uncharacterised protein [Neisseria meningitidis]